MANLFDTSTFAGAFGGTVVPPPIGSPSTDNGTNYIFPTAWTNTGNTSAKRSQVTFVVDPNGLLIAQGANSWY
jgi:hypothetical protein